MKKLLALALMFFAFALPAKAFETPTHLQSVYYTYNTNTPGFYNLDSHVKWEFEPKTGWGYYSMFWFWFQGQTGGYMGLQQGPSGQSNRMAIFSIWDKVPGNVKSTPVSSWCQRFGHEGYGAQCIISYAWKPNTEYKLRIWKLSVQDNPRGVMWGGWVVNTVTAEETLIGVILVENYQNYNGYGDLANRGHNNTLEFWAGDSNATCYTAPEFNVTWKGPYGNNGTISPKTAQPLYNTRIGSPCPNTDVVSNAPFSISQKFGPNVVKTTQENMDTHARWNKQELDQVDCVFDWAQHLFPGEFDQSKFHHRRLSNYSQATNTYYRDYRLNNTGYTLGYDMSNQDMVITDSAGITYNVGDISGYITAASCSGVVR